MFLIISLFISFSNFYFSFINPGNFAPAGKTLSVPLLTIGIIGIPAFIARHT